jgi:hypothetical protein
MKRKYSVTIIPDKKAETFSPSYCKCKECESIEKSNLEWNIFKEKTSNKTPLQIRMIKVVSKIESDIKKRKSI